jgi:hypothetical protein
MGIVYHFIYFAPVNPAARMFAAMFLVAAAFFAWAGVARGRLVFDGESRARRVVGHALIAYALLVYPLLSLLLGRQFPGLPTFGLPCPTTIFTIGMLVLPIVWAFIGGQAASTLGVYEDIALLAAGLAGVWLVFDRPARTRAA